MMGANHAAMGAGSWFALTSAGPWALGWAPAEPRLVLIGMLTTGGAALLPDWDHQQATVTRSLPPLSNLICVGVEKLAGGHRAGTHSLIGIAAFTALAFAAGLVTHTTEGGHTLQMGAGVLCLFLASLALGALKILPRGSYLAAWGISIALASAVAWYAPGNAWWLPTSVGMGVAVHIIGDVLTVGGVKVLWPFTTTNFSVPVLGKTGSWKEWIVGIAFSLYAVYGLGSSALGIVPNNLLVRL